ncbi:MAG TPA: TetR/AcrR family transcriptional regulator [Acidimicrobiia bacterium]|nr:TetR/AcrR family transcriptional regulator [Acidimicrobiia bacterium]
MLGNLNSDRSNVDSLNRDRRSRRREATKAEILDAAWALVREHGLAGLSLRDLAARVGMRAPSLYQYFPSKHAIYDAMFGQGARQALAEVGAPVGTTDAREALLLVAHRMFDFVTSNPERALLLFQRTIPGFEPSPESYAPAVELLDWSRLQLVERGLTDPDALDLWTALLSGLSNQQMANDPGGTRWARLVDRAVGMYLAEVGPPSAGSRKGKR